MKKIIHITLCCILLTLCGCNKNEKLKQELNSFQNKEIQMPLKQMVQYHQEEDILEKYQDSILLKMVVYNDSNACAACTMRTLHQWNILIRKAQVYQGKLKFYFVFAPAKKAFQELIYVIKTSELESTVYVDTLGVFKSINMHLPDNNMLHSFLLDKDNRVVLVGSPLQNDKMEKLFWEAVDNKLKN